jgi:type II secretory ATPase GspE/PulE/Tfp pilus assembly ATPase PilB-like protein
MRGPIGLADDADFYERLARHAGVPYRVLDPRPGDREDPVDHRAAALIGWPTARAFGVVPVAVEANRLVVAVSDPFALESLHVVRELTRREVTAVLASPRAIARAQDRAYGPRPHGSPGRVPGTVPRTRPPETSEEERRRTERLARHAGLEFVTLDEVDRGAARSLPEPVCRHLRLLPLARETNRLTIAVADPRDEVAPRVVYAMTGDIPRVVVAAPGDIERAISRVFAPETEGHTSE